MSTITDWIKYELYPVLFENIDRTFPKHEFKRYPGGWRSKTYLDGSKHATRLDKTVVTKKAPGMILEQGGEAMSLIDYVIKRDGVEFIQAVKTLAQVVGLKLPEDESFDKESYKQYKEKVNLLEEANSYFTYCLVNSKYAEAIKDYLKARGYTSQEVVDMELGYIPDQQKLNKYLEGKGYTRTAIREALPIHKDTRLGTTHSLTIPYRSGGAVRGFKFRTITPTDPKYINSSGLDRNSGFFNISAVKGDKDIIIVEGELDALHASVKGLDNVVATGGSSINAEQVKDAIKRGAKRFTLCFDYEKGKELETRSKIASAIKVILSEGVNRVYIAELPDTGADKTDPDSLIKDQGLSAFKDTISKAPTYYEYYLQTTLDSFLELEESQNELTSKDKDDLLEEVVLTATSIDNPIDRDQYKKKFLETFEVIGITPESLDTTVDRITFDKHKEEQERDFRKLLDEASKLQSAGNTGKAIELLSNQVKQVKLKDKATEFSNLLTPVKESEIRERQANKPDSLNSGYTVDDEPLLLPSGAISIFTAPTSHGKTSLLINTALNVAEQYKDKQVYLFSYEEDADSILMKSLNASLNETLNNRRNLDAINYYFKTGKAQYIRREAVDYFIAGKERFFKEFIDSSRLNIHYSSYDSDTLIEAIRYLHKNTNIGAVFIDYIQLLNLPQGKYKTYSRQEEIKEVCIALKDLAVETGLPIILGAQFNRTVTNHLHLHPTKIGEAGDIERIANLIVGFWNNSFKIEGTDGEKSEIAKQGINEPGTIYAEILKNRGGKVGLNQLFDFDGNKGRVENRVGDEIKAF